MAPPTLINRYFLAGRLLTEVADDPPPASGAEVCIDGRYYLVQRAIRHITMLPPWRTHVHLVIGPGDEPPLKR